MIDEPNLGRVCALLATLINEVRALRSDTAGRSASAPHSLRPADTATLCSLLPLIAGIMGAEVFLVRDMLERARQDSPPARALRDALAKFGVADNARKIGRLLRRAAVADIELAGFFVDGVGDVREGALWRVIAETRETRTARCVAAGLAGEFKHEY